MIRGLISEGTPCVPVATDGVIWYTLLATSDGVAAFASTARETYGLTRCVVTHRFDGGSSFSFKRKTVVFPEQASLKSYDDFGSFTMTPDNVNLPEEGLFSGVSYSTSQTFACFLSGSSKTLDCDTSPMADAFRGVDVTATVKKQLKIIFVPYTTAMTRFNEGLCMPVTSRDQLFFEFIGAIDGLGTEKPPRGCAVLNGNSRGCYNTGPSCYSIAYCNRGATCDSKKCYGRVADTGQCVIKGSGYAAIQMTATKPTWTSSDNGGEPDSVIPKQVSTTRNNKRLLLIAAAAAAIMIVVVVAFLLLRHSKRRTSTAK